MESVGRGCALTVDHVVPVSQRSLLHTQLGLSGHTALCPVELQGHDPGALQFLVLLPSAGQVLPISTCALA